MSKKFFRFEHKKELVLKYLALELYILVFLAATFIFLFSRYQVHDLYSFFESVQYDDSYITYRHAFNLLNGEGLVFNPGDKTNSASSLTFVLLLAFLSKVLNSDNFPIISLAISQVSVFLIVYSFLAFHFVSEKKLIKRLIIICATSILISNQYFQYWSYSGMEYSFYLFIFLISFIISIRYIYSPERKWFLTLCLVLVILTLTRVDGFVIAFALAFMVGIYISKKSNDFKLRYFKLNGIVVATFSLQLLSNKLYYGDAFGNPVKFKRLADYYTLTVNESLKQIKEFVFEMPPYIPALLIFGAVMVLLPNFFKIKDSTDLKVLQTSYLVLFALLSYLAISPFSDYYRYQLPLIIPISIICVRVVLVLFSILPQTPTSTLLLFVLISAGYLSTQSFYVQKNIDLSNSVFPRLYIQEARITLGKWMEINLPKKSVVLSGDLGALSYFNESNYYLDSTGLTNKKLLSVVQKSGDYFSEISAQNPDYIADSIDASGSYSSELIVNSPQKYFDALKTDVYSSCNFQSAFDEKIIKVLPTVPNPLGISVGVSALTSKSCL